MAKGYLPVDRDQQFLVPPDMREWLPKAHLVWWLLEDGSGFFVGIDDEVGVDIECGGRVAVAEPTGDVRTSTPAASRRVAT
jgi:hypothetical protein